MAGRYAKRKLKEPTNRIRIEFLLGGDMSMKQLAKRCGVPCQYLQPYVHQMIHRTRELENKPSIEGERIIGPRSRNSLLADYWIGFDKEGRTYYTRNSTTSKE